MTKQNIINALQFTSQTLPFLIITGIFVGMAYTYGHSFSPYHIGEPADLIRLSCNYLP